MNTFPTTPIGGLEISRLVIGTNTFHGHSHFSKARSDWLRRYFTPERVYEVVRFCVEQGLNATVSATREDYAEVLRAVERDTGVHVVWFATPGGRDLAELKDNIAQTAELGADFCLPHTSWTDARLLPSRGIIEEAEEAMACIRAHGMRTGWSTHRPETVTITDKQDYDIDTYIQIYNAEGFLMHVETDWAGRIIRHAKRPCLCIKPLGAGRIMAPTGLSFVYSTIKPSDVVAIGMLSVEEAAEDIDLARQILAGQMGEAALQETRSKAIYAAT